MQFGGRCKGVLYDIDFRLSAGRETHFHHIEPDRNAWFTQQLQPCHGPAHNQRLLAGGNRFHRGAKLPAAAAFHLDEHQCVAMARHQVDLSPARGPEIAIENPVPCTAQGTGGQALPFPSQLCPVVPKRDRAALSSGEETCDDGSEKAHILPAWQDAPGWHTPCAGKNGIVGKGRPSRS